MTKLKVVSGIAWSFFEQLLRRGISIVVTLFLARFLVPEDFGLLAVMTVFIAIATALMDSGIKQAVIRKLNPVDAYFSTAFYANIGLGALAYSLLFLAAPFIADFYDEPRLTLLIRMGGCVIVINAFQVIQVALLSRDLNFKLQVQANVPAGIVSGSVAVLMAYLGFGVWALITQTVLNALLVVVVYWWVQPWRPSQVFDFSSLKEMYNFGYKLFLSQLLSTLSSNIYVLVIAKVFSAQVAGLYFFADQIKSLMINQLVTSIQKVTYPALSMLQDDNVRLKANYRKLLQTTTFLFFPSILLFAALAETLFLAVLPARWLPAVLYLQLMCIAALLYPLHSINLNILKVKGRSDLYLAISIFKKVTQLSILFISYRYGVAAILIGHIIQSVIVYLPNSYYSNKLIGYTVREQLADMLPNLIMAVVIGSFVYLVVGLVEMAAVNKLFLFGVFGCVAYILLAKFIGLSGYRLVEGLLVQGLLKRKKWA